MPLGNLTSQFFANFYLNELDQFVKHKLKAKYYIRYVDDFVILHTSKKQLRVWKDQISIFLGEKLRLELHKDKSCIIPISMGVDFVGFRNFYYCNLLRRRNINNIQRKIKSFNKGEKSYKKLFDSFQGWNAYAKWSNNYKLTKHLIKSINPP
jgi:RNA-directed DNA polymerase